MQCRSRKLSPVIVYEGKNRFGGILGAIFELHTYGSVVVMIVLFKVKKAMHRSKHILFRAGKLCCSFTGNGKK